ncbi:TMV resistance protein N-like, partial [Trifolium medium]|nr:TMV resistance protein N-like [Trifolium medium]
MTSLTTLVADNTAITRVPFALSWMSPRNGILSLVQTFAGTSSLEFLDEQNDSFYGLPSVFKDLQDLQRLWLKFESEAQLNQTLA